MLQKHIKIYPHAYFAQSLNFFDQVTKEKSPLVAGLKFKMAEFKDFRNE